MGCKVVSFRFQDETKNMRQERDPVQGYLGNCGDEGVGG